MDFEKKLVILSGKAGRGTVQLERNGMGSFVTVNVFSLPDLTAGEYALGVKTATTAFRREVGSLGRIKSRFALPEGDYAAVHFVLFRTYDEEPVLYGTGESRKMWESNLMDGLRRKGRDEAKTDEKEIAATTQEFKYSERKVEDYFLSVDPSVYRDNAIAEENYYEYYEKPALPSAMERQYLARRFAHPFDTIREEEENIMRSRKIAGEGREVAEETAKIAAFASTRELLESVKRDEPFRIKNASEYTAEQAVKNVKTGAGFYASVKAGIDKLFAECERFSPLEDALPGTKWVKVNYDERGRYYTVGLIGTAPDYIAYGVPGKYGEFPSALEGADFVPTGDKGGEGFWVLFQSAETGKEISGRR